MLGFKKTNGILRNIFGQSVYEIDFELTIQFVRDAWMKGNSMEGYWRNDFQASISKPDLYASGQQYLYDVKFFPVGTTYKITGTATMENTDNGYKLKKHELKTFTNLGVRSVQNEYAQNNSEQQKASVPVIKIINNPVGYKIFKGYLSTGSSNLVIKISNIRISDELNNISEAQTKILESLSKMRRLQKPNWEPNNTSVDTLLLEVNAEFTYRNYSSSALASYFVDCKMELRLLNSKNSLLYNNNYKLSNYKLISNGFASPLDANKNLIASNDFNQSLSQFITGNFPLTGEIIEVIEKKKSEAKTVKINIGRSSGIFVGYNFLISDYNSTDADIKVVEVFDDYCLCKVSENAKKILQDITLGKKLKIITPYKP